MARLTAAAAGGLVWATTLLMCAALGAGQNILVFYPQPGSLPPPVQINYRRNPLLNVAVRGGEVVVRDGKVVLATADCHDVSQKWYPVYNLTLFTSFFDLFQNIRPSAFSLVNAKTFQVITIPPGGNKAVGLSTPFNVGRALDQLWQPELPRPDKAGFYQLFVKNNPGLTLNGLGGGVTAGIPVGIYPAEQGDNSLWKITPSPPCYP